MKIIYFIVFMILTLNQLPAQQFSPVGQGFNHAVKTLYADTTTNLVYAGGNFEELSTGENMGKIAVWNGVAWDSLGSGINTGSYVYKINKYGNDIFVGGSMQTMNGLNYRGLAYWDGINWNSIGDATGDGYGRVRGLASLDQDLYVLGNFDSVSTISANKIARWDGIQWHSLPVLDSTNGGWGIFTAAIYNGELYVGGNFEGQGSPYLKDIAKFDGTSWMPVGNGFSGFVTSVSDMLVFQGELYVSGAFQTAFGDPANGIVKWDGNNWSQLGLGIEGGVLDMEVYNNELYVCGTIFSVEGNTAGNVAKWNGSQWSNLNANFNSVVECLTILNDEVYFGGNFYEVNGMPVNFVCKYTIPVGIEESGIPINFNIYPNPAKDKLFLSSNLVESNQHYKFRIKDNFGRTLLTKSFNEIKLKEEIDISFLGRGIYQVCIENNGVLMSIRKLVVIK